MSLRFDSWLSWLLDVATLSRSHPQLSIAAVHETAMSIAKACPFVPAVIFIRVLCQVAEIVRFHVVAVHHVIGSHATAFRGGGSADSPRLATPVAFVAASPTLHAQTSLQPCKAVCGDAVHFAVATADIVATTTVDPEFFAVGILAGEI
jgi:hypothetical protein